MFISYAQNFEDVMLNRLFQGKDTGFYLDIGAHHPTYDSVTKAFYDRGWRGINIEPVKEFFNLLQQERPKDINLNIAINNHENELTFFELQNSGFSTLDGEIAAKLAQENDLNLIKYPVKARSLAEICQEYVNCPIDFLKIDVEGWEEQVIVGNDWVNFRPSVIILEATWPGKPIRKKTKILEFLETQDYHFVYFDGLNDFYLAQEAQRFRSCFETPPNVFDNFTLFRLVDAQNNLKSLNIGLNNQQLETQRLYQQLSQLQQVREEMLHHYEKQTNELYLKLSEQETKSNEDSTQLGALQKQLEQANERILAMETSKFWKIRKIWFHIRQSLGISGE